MRQVMNCDFCGDDASGVYEPLPSSVPEAPRMLLCDDCRDRLSTVVDPLLAHLPEDTDRGEGTRGPSEPRGAGDGGTVPGTDSSTRVATDRTAAGSSVRRAVDVEEESTADAGRPAVEVPDGADPSSNTRSPGEGVNTSRDASGRTQSERGGAPRGYRKVMRFLENRSLPIERSEAERLAAEAYEFDESEVGEAIDHAVQYGRLREVSGELRR